MPTSRRGFKATNIKNNAIGVGKRMLMGAVDYNFFAVSCNLIAAGFTHNKIPPEGLFILLIFFCDKRSGSTEEVTFPWISQELCQIENCFRETNMHGQTSKLYFIVLRNDDNR
ncbi:MAG: hypothetical protein COX19_12835 [Desulfobacterales bacterium CG23_combo_of_CG06-09_8_20_14_all_51_8]|nr:MAG: hypothetical protein COX19_12835 [Desulfobacterales bacterium CG23_combo_of_CG06-09_8_20_14_all_51_8]